MEGKANQEGTKTMDIIRSPPGSSYYGCGTPGLWSNAEDQRRLVSYSPTFQQGLFQPILQLQKDVGCPFGPQTFSRSHSQTQRPKDSSEIRQHDSGQRNQSPGSGSESSFSAEDYPKDDNRMEYSNESGAPSKSKERDRGLLIKTPARGRLRDHRRSIKRAGTSAGSNSRTGRL
ncbi:uncharacterized protein MONOS_4971 [Monocercomonoides exilis]|uniref:uncharacterized protein n=1 Tax=Monocercomonoides exilis TaxID=2049356 RepID=UPI0035596B01|nr:hypothetical protein MONOS_4971 [Monocercomonoides exilis]|eukprot:MONOS_4971.1-p1 / transcript=MONOS_4971.1 / gene=MONOS_4971 / organism=Monocercomonoides_exilis_PA203 / gene_product=unspecified product / transcript_product=unspecified product / location=Mono_scaffold00139:66417-66938(-) / protein_length=174 / sequence_SO=supercontig / SO=protein_coding / is_pseudo=false